MSTDRDLILSTRKYAKEDRAKSWRLLAGTITLLLLAYAGAIVNVHIAAQIACGLLAALTSVRLFIIYHDYLHGTILQKSKLADAVFTLFGMFILAPPSIWKRSHDYHHAHNSKLYTSSIGSFPLVTKKQFLAAKPGERAMYLFIRHPLTIALGYLFAFLWGMCLRTMLRSPGKHIDCMLALVFHYGIAVGIYFLAGWQGVLIGFLLPAVINSAMGSYLFYAQHNFPDAKFKPKEEWSYVFAAMHSSSYMKMGPVMQWFTGNIGYHHIHHINPSIPFYNLPTVFEELEQFQHPGTTSLNPADIAKCFRVKVWDAEQDRMISRSEAFA